MAAEAWSGELMISPAYENVESQYPVPAGKLPSLRRSWRGVGLAVMTALLLTSASCQAEQFVVGEVSLPPLRIAGKPAKAHTQGLEVAGGRFYVTARREDVRPRRALLLRAAEQATRWEAWDITPTDREGAATALDHPGGMQSDGTRLWVPVAESRRNSRAMILVFLVAELEEGRRPKPVLEFPVSDHIGALAVSEEAGLVLGANWDTEKIYVWDLKGHLQRTLTGTEMGARGLGVVAGPGGHAGVAVQDWKIVGDRVYASGLFRAPLSPPASPASRLCEFERFLEPDCRRQIATLPRKDGVELGREAMAVSGGSIYLLPEDLGATNRLFRLALADLAKRAKRSSDQ